MDKFFVDLKHFFDCINWGQSALDAEAIQFMNEITKRVEGIREEGRKVGYDEGFEAGQVAALKEKDPQ